MILTPQQASEIIGVPAVQLQRWAYLGQGPRNSGTKHKPMYDEDDLKDWLRKSA
jgi:predicted site-specific integrase-resolvase